MLDIMNLEAQLLAEIEERQEKLEKVRGVSPKLQALEALLNECQSVCSEFGMTDLFSSVLSGFATTTPQSSPNPATPTQANAPTATAENSIKLSDKEIKAIRVELKAFLEYTGDRLNNVTAKELLIKKLEELNKQDLLAEVNLDDKENFLTEAKKLLTLAKEETLTVAKEDLTVAKEDLTVAKEDLTVAKEDLTVAKEDLTVAKEDLTVAKEDLTVAKEDLTVAKEDGLNPKDAIKSALVQNLVNGYYGTVEQDGVINCGALVRYPNATELTPLQDLKLVSPAIFTPTPITPITPIEEIKEEVSIEEKEEEIKDMTPQEKMMWDALISADFTPEELSALSTDKETVDGYNSTNGTNLTSLPIAELYEYTMGVGRIE